MKIDIPNELERDMPMQAWNAWLQKNKILVERGIVITKVNGIGRKVRQHLYYPSPYGYPCSDTPQAKEVIEQ